MTYTDQQLWEIQERADAMHQTALTLYWKHKRAPNDTDAWLLRHQFEVLAALMGLEVIEPTDPRSTRAMAERVCRPFGAALEVVEGRAP